MSWSNFEAADGQIISINMDEVVSVINYPNDKADILMKNGCMHTVTFIGPREPEEQHPMDEPHPINEVIQDLKLENDRLMQRDELMLKFISDLYDKISDKDCLIMRSELIRTMVTLRKQLEDL